MTVSGTANEIVTSASGQAITVALPDNVIVGGGLTVTTDLTVSGVSTFNGVTNIGVGGTTLTGITTNSRIGINSTAPNYNLDVGGIINSSTDVRINGSSVLDEAIAMAIALG